MNPHVQDAFRHIHRRDFLPPNVQDLADFDEALPIGYGQTNSNPEVVELMLEWLDPQPGQKILDVGSGSGWTTALLSRLVGNRGYIYAVELVPDLVEFGRNNCEKLGLTNLSFHQAGPKLGLPEHAPYDRILVSASTTEIPMQLLEQLKTGGKMVIPVYHDVVELIKHDNENWTTQSHPGFIFVPLL